MANNLEREMASKTYAGRKIRNNFFLEQLMVLVLVVIASFVPAIPNLILRTLGINVYIEDWRLTALAFLVLAVAIYLMISSLKNEKKNFNDLVRYGLGNMRSIADVKDAYNEISQLDRKAQKYEEFFKNYLKIIRDVLNSGVSLKQVNIILNDIPDCNFQINEEYLFDDTGNTRAHGILRLICINPKSTCKVTIVTFIYLFLRDKTTK